MEKLDISSPEWHEHVMSLFTEDELADGKPKITGLRRVANQLLGAIVVSRPVQIFPVQEEGYGRATVSYEIVIHREDGERLTFGDVADCWSQNTDQAFLAHAVATACTRAESRTLRKALYLKVLSAEETKEGVVVSFEAGEEPIYQSQIQLIDSKCGDMNIDVLLFINTFGDYKTIDYVSRSQAGKMIQKLNNYDKDEQIPEDIMGYKKGWHK